MYTAKLEKVFEDTKVELLAAMKNHPKFYTPHDGWAILREEVDELWDEVKKKPSKRSKNKLRKEAVQVAAMAIRFVHDICGKD